MAEQLIAARRLDSFILKQRAKDKVGCCSLGAAESERSALSGFPNRCYLKCKFLRLVVE